jgi:hypothetical protein
MAPSRIVFPLSCSVTALVESLDFGDCPCCESSIRHIRCLQSLKDGERICVTPSGYDPNGPLAHLLILALKVLTHLRKNCLRSRRPERVPTPAKRQNPCLPEVAVERSRERSACPEPRCSPARLRSRCDVTTTARLLATRHQRRQTVQRTT